jgi:hypothetical protein
MTGRNAEKLLRDELGNKAWEIIDLPEGRNHWIVSGYLL